MKKILTLLVMFLATASILTAQTPQPRLNYQMIVREKSNNNLVVNQSVSGTVNVLTAGVTVYTKEFTSTTNMNGMLTILLDDQTGPAKLNEIDWTQSQFKVTIDAYGIDTIMDIYPVLYAYKTFMNDNITTPRIVKYINNSKVGDVEDINGAITGNASFINALRDSVANAMKRNPGMVKQLTVYFLDKVTPTDVHKAFDTINDATAKFVKDTIAKYIKNHREEAISLAKYFIGQTTEEDVTGLWNAAMKNQQIDQIVSMIVDSVNKYIERNPELAMKTAKYIVGHVSADQVFALQNFTKANNQKAYDTAKAILNDLIDTFMINNHYQPNQCNGQPINLCELQAEIAKYAQYRDVACPSFGQTSVNNNIAETPIIPPTTTSTFPLSDDGHYWYELTFPYSTYSPVTVAATLENGTSGYVMTANLSDYQHYKYVLRAKMEQPCMDLATYGEDTPVYCQDCLCPEIAPNSFSYTSTAVADLSTYQGVQLKAKLTNNYLLNESTTKWGFEVSTNGGETWKKLKENPTLSEIDGLTFVDTIKMNYCDKNLKVRAYVKCGNDTNYSANVAEFQLRDLKLVVAPTSTNPDSLIATNGIHISTQSYINEFHTEWPSVEQIVAKYGSTFGVSVNPEYKWYEIVDGDETEVHDTNDDNAYSPYDANKQYKVTCSFSIFNSDPCVLEATYPVQQ